MENNRVTMMQIYHILKGRGSEDLAVDAKWIAEEMQKRLNLPKPPDKKTVRKHLENLLELSDQDLLECTIEQYKAGNTHYYYSRPRFEPSEIKMLCDAVAFSRFIDRKFTEDLIRKLGETIGVDWLGRYGAVLELKSQGKIAYNHELFLNIELLSSAIEKRQKAHLVYTRYDINKKLVPVCRKNGGVITVHPYSLIWTLNHYYLFCEIEESGLRRFLRVDKIKNVQVLEGTSVKPLPPTINLTKYVANQAFMFGGEPTDITLRCRMDMLGQVIDHFGEDADIRPVDDQYFEFHVRSSIESMKFWVLQYITAIDDIRPKELKEIVTGYLEDALQRHKER